MAPITLHRFVISLIVTTTSTLVVTILAAFSRKERWNKLTLHQAKAEIFYFFVTFMIFPIVFYLDFVPDTARIARSTMQDVYSTEWVIISTSICFMFMFLAIFTLPIALLKLVRFRGEIAD